MVMDDWVKIDLGNGLLPDGTKPLPEPMLTYRHWGSITITYKGKFTQDTFNTIISLKIKPKSSKGLMGEYEHVYSPFMGWWRSDPIGSQPPCHYSGHRGESWRIHI